MSHSQEIFTSYTSEEVSGHVRISSQIVSLIFRDFMSITWNIFGERIRGTRFSPRTSRFSTLFSVAACVANERIFIRRSFSRHCRPYIGGASRGRDVDHHRRGISFFDRASGIAREVWARGWLSCDLHCSAIERRHVGQSAASSPS